MRKIALLIAMVAVAGCGGFKKTFGIKDAPPAHTEPKTTSIYGDWVLANIDSTALCTLHLSFKWASPCSILLNTTGTTLLIRSTCSTLW